MAKGKRNIGRTAGKAGAVIAIGIGSALGLKYATKYANEWKAEKNMRQRQKTEKDRKIRKEMQKRNFQGTPRKPSTRPKNAPFLNPWNEPKKKHRIKEREIPKTPIVPPQNPARKKTNLRRV